MHQIQIENSSPDQDAFFVKEILVPYLSSVYFGLIKRQNRDYLGIQKTKQYLAMPELIGDRLVKQINANGDERIDHDEFVPFFLKLLMGTLEQKMYIAFRIFDVDDDQSITEDEVRVVLKNIPVNLEKRHSFSEGVHNTRVEHLNQVRKDYDQIGKFVESVFSEHPGGMYFDEFVKLAEEATSELFVAVFDCIYQCVPCVKNFLLLRANFQQFIKL
jgi:Ca2+-binding EF-hand superfamily protein